ncbi:MAG: aminotransferase class III-fold pyridoxal phosphate-dependent enzyme [Gemmatimonadaceae bacterium]|nr:aminotransferase class III-fold pyridoxal phosphate-dependent enzyme [Gemmatimonadaceae bacterium]
MTGVPQFTTDAAAALALHLYGVAADVTSLPSERDQNFRLVSTTGRAFVLKIANAGESLDVLRAECAVMHHVAAAATCPHLITTIDGHEIARAGAHFVRLISALPGTPLGDIAYRTPALRTDIGRALATLNAALSDFDHPAFHRDFHWDLANAARVVHELLPQVTDAALRTHIAAFAAQHDTTVVPALDGLRRSVIHADANDYNLLVDARAQVVTGIIDFGDMVYSHTVNDVAIAMAYVMLDADDPLAGVADVLRGYHAVHPLSDAEISVAWTLACMRLCVSACMAARQQAARPDDAYLGISQGPIARTLPRLASIHPRFAHYTLREACGLAPVPNAPRITDWITRNQHTFAPLLGVDLSNTPVAPLDFSAGSTLISSQSEQNAPALLDARIRQVLAEHGATIGVGGYDEARLIYHWPHEPKTSEPRTIHIGLDLSLPAGSPLYAPLDGTVHGFEDADHHHDYGPLIVLRHVTTDADPLEFFSFYGHLTRDSLHKLHVGKHIAQGTEFARIGSDPTNGHWWSHVHVQLATDMLEVPCNVDGAVRASQRHTWHSIFPDPNLMLGTPASRLPHHVATADIAASRRAHIGGNLSISYGSNPLHIVRGSGQYLYDEHAHRYIDGYNNVAHVGHGHPRVVRAVSEQMALLNTNTRYLQDQLTRYAAALTALLPDSLTVCYFTASGSEANELALRLARAHTGARDLIVMDSAYHGHTTTLIDISPYKHDGPGGSGAPDWVHTSPVPDVYRTRGISGEPGAWFAARVGEVIDHVGSMGRRLSGYIAETCPSVAGQIMLPEGFLREVYARVRAVDGVCIADEVQTGFGRTGSHFWAFEAHGVTPDIVVLGKPIANGYPMGAVITTRAIAESFDNGMEYFSTFGGSTVACVAGMATLQVTLDEQLQQHALTVGSHLRHGLRELMSAQELIGDVRGSGLFLGVELVRDRLTLEPADTEASFVVNRMRARGVLVGTDGPYHNVIKIRGPMLLSRVDCDRIVETLAEALRECASLR